MAISSYSTTPANNTALFPEGMNPADVNNGMRQVQADIRSWYEVPQWRDLGHVPTRTSNTTFTTPGDLTTTYVTGMRLRFTDNAAFLYGTVVSSSYSSPNTSVTVTMDSGVLDSNLTNVGLGIDPTNKPIPGTSISGFDNPTFQTITTTGNGTIGNNLSVTGTLGVTGMTTLGTVNTTTLTNSANATIGAGTGARTLTVNGGNSSNQGAAVYMQRLGVTVNLIGNVTSVSGGAYTDDMGLYSAGNIRFFSNGFSETAQINNNGMIVGTGTGTLPIFASNSDKALVVFTVSGTTVTINRSLGITSVTRISAGVFDITLSTGITNGIPRGTAWGPGGNGVAVTGDNQSTQSVPTSTVYRMRTIQLNGTTTAVIDPTYCAITWE